MRAFGAAFRNKKDQFIVAFSTDLILIVIASSLMFFAESRVQPDIYPPPFFEGHFAALQNILYKDFDLIVVDGATVPIETSTPVGSHHNNSLSIAYNWGYNCSSSTAVICCSA
jgi:hypothetical protein